MRQNVAPYTQLVVFIESLPVLLVEDDEADQHLTRQALLRFQRSIILHTVSSVKAAQSYLSASGPFAQAERPACIILDLQLSDGSGRDLLNWMQRRESFATLPVIVFTSSPEPLKHDYIACQLSKPAELSGYDQLEKGLGGILMAAARGAPNAANDNFAA